MDRYNSLLAQASSLKLGPRPDDITDQVSKLQALLDKHTGRVAQWPVLLAKQPARQERGPKKGSKSGVKGAKCGKLAPGRPRCCLFQVIIVFCPKSFPTAVLDMY